MNNIIKKVEELKLMIMDTNEYKIFINNKNKIDNDKELTKVIKEIKEKQKVIVNKESKKENIDQEEFELQNLYSKLNSNSLYKEYIISAKNLNKIITKIQKKFEEYFNSFLIN